MDELVAKIVADTRVTPEVARKSVVIILKFLRHEAPADTFADLIAAPSRRRRGARRQWRRRRFRGSWGRSTT